MKRLILGVFILFSVSLFSHAQIKSVTYNVVNNEINSNNPLPSEEPFFIKGTLPEGIDLVKVIVNRTGKNERLAEEYFWKRAFEFPVSQYELFVSRELRSNDNYDLEFHYFRKADNLEMSNVRTSIYRNLEAYIRANFEVTSRGIRTNHSDPVMMTQMNQIVTDALEDFRHFLGRDFRGFSEIVRQKLDQKSRLRLNRARFNILGKNELDNEKAAYAAQYINELIQLVQSETSQYLDNSLLALAEIRTVSNYPTERKPGTLPLNFGYGSIAVKRSLSSTEYLHGPYVGLSLPLGNQTFTRFLGNASISTGVFLQNFGSRDGTIVRGELVGLPIYAGLGYKMFRVLRLNVGAVMLNIEESNGNFSPNHIQPFAGISLEFNMWLGLRDRR
ncbi:hypothetical protein A33Q_2022 [Indibacter alkaliphilus LW1]|uniref:Uncharacterized protein n=1 Tax=Indibacter alkaliphilus (strain CCUG 57479 / KCTC 22604 / LW1) TaxID=1189612 RepID=S2DC00_INDAL|nr:hypothetical protein [Indibacter alkaliphilus]EOZ96712.1 hypothetical protein A33Q_2022 [Indibacter alkaliphilus LW1]